jgi:hypothetical protein
MFGRKLSRTGLLVALLGLAVLGASFYAWTGTLHDSRGDFKWVRADSSSDPAVESDEVWQAPATCQMPYFVAAALRAKAKLKAHYDAAPEEIRLWRDRPVRPPAPRIPTEEADFQDFLKRQQAEVERKIAETDYDSHLHAKYMEWYVAASRLEAQVKQWEQRLSNVTDQKITLSQARNKSLVYANADPDQVGALRDGEQRAFMLLGLGGFSRAQLQAIKATCLQITPIKKIAAKIDYFAELHHWPADQIVPFWLGLELVLVGLFFSPISKWIGTGEISTEWRHVADTAHRLFNAARDLIKSFMARTDPRIRMAGRLVVLVVQDLANAFIAWADPHIRKMAQRVALAARGLANTFIVQADPHIRKLAKRVATAADRIRKSKYPPHLPFD